MDQDTILALFRRSGASRRPFPAFIGIAQPGVSAVCTRFAASSGGLLIRCGNCGQSLTIETRNRGVSSAWRSRDRSGGGSPVEYSSNLC